ncbi:DUF5947 family protein [Spirillospora sp. CA-255316]
MSLQPPLSVLRRFHEPEPRRRRSACEVCGEAFGTSDGPPAHAVDLERRGMVCVCRACALLVTHGEGWEPSGRRFRIVPDRHRHRHVRDFALTARQWETLGLPVGIAFLFRNSRLGRFVALYPSPGGTTEWLPPEGAWEAVVAANPPLADLADDVEAVVLRRGRRPSSGGAVECHLVPISVCHDLVGRLRLYWLGLDGGPRVRDEIDGFFDALRERGGAHG